MNICWLPILHYSFMKKSLKVKSPRETEKQSSDSVNVNKSKGHMKFKFRRGGGRGGGGEKVECNWKIGCGILLISIILQGPTANRNQLYREGIR